MHQKIKFDNPFQILHYLIGEKNVGALFHWVFFRLGKISSLRGIFFTSLHQNFKFVTFPRPNFLNVPEKYSGFKKELSRFLVIRVFIIITHFCVFLGYCKRKVWLVFTFCVFFSLTIFLRVSSISSIIYNVYNGKLR